MPQPCPPARRILITGCSSGIGLDAARSLTARGLAVYATCRRPEDCDRLRAEGLDSFPLDYADPASLDAAMVQVAARGGLDALYNNGAWALPGAVEDLPRDGLRAIFEATLFGWHALTRRVIPLMRAQGHGRIVNCSSVLGIVPAKWRGAYVSTKYALEGLTDVLRLEMADAPIRVILIQPGPIATEIRRNSRRPFETWIDWQSAARAAEYRSTLLARLYDEPPRPTPGELPPSAVTRVLIRALEAPHPRARYRVTWPTFAAETMRRLLPVTWRDRVCARG